MVTRNSDHIYRNEQGEVYVSVTQHLQIAGLVDFSMVKAEDLEYARIRGGYVHEAINLFCYDDLNMDSLDVSYKGYVEAYIKFHKEYSVVPLSSEEIVWNDARKTAGTYDQVCKLNGEKAMVEIKSTATMPVTASLQASIYMDYYNRRKEPEQRLKNAYGLHLRKNGTYKLYKYKWPINVKVFEGIVETNWWVLANKVRTVGAKADENIHNLCKTIINRGN